LRKQLNEHDPLDYEGLTTLGNQLTGQLAELDKNESEWLDVAQKLQGG